MTQRTRGVLIMGGQNEQAYLRIRNTNGRNISNLHTHRRVGRAKALTETDPNTTSSNEADTNTNMCCLGQNIIPIAYKTGWKMSTHIVKRMTLLKICLLFLGIQLTMTPMGILTSYYSMSRSIMFYRWSTSSLTPIIYVSIFWHFMITLL